MLGEIRFELGLRISPKVGRSNHDLISFSGILPWVEAVDQLDLHQVGPKPGSFPMEELDTNIVFELNLVVRGSWATARGHVGVGYAKLG